MWQHYKGLKVFDRRQRQALTPLRHSENSPTKVGAQVSPSSTMILRASVHECKGESVHKNGAECWVRGVQCLVQELCQFATRHSLPFYHSPFTFATRYSPLANRHSPPFSIQHEPRPPKFVHRKIWERGEEGEMACGKFGFQFDCKQPLRNALDCSRLAGA